MPKIDQDQIGDDRQSDRAFYPFNLASGKKEDRPGLAACLKTLCEDDMLVVWKLDCLGRDLRHLANTVQELAAQNIGF